MSCVEVTGNICFDLPEPDAGLEAVYAKPVFWNGSTWVTPDTLPYLAPRLQWESGYSGTLPDIRGWCRPGTQVVGMGSENTMWAYYSVDISTLNSTHVRVTFTFDTEDDVVVDLYGGVSGPYKINMPNETVVTATVRTLSSAPSV